jgi:DNA-binding NarL/FixJ family response regulator
MEARRARRHTAAMGYAAAAAEEFKVFLVEDSPEIRERLLALFASVEGARTVGYADGAEAAIRDILAERPDAVVLDVSLAQGSGIDVLRALRAQAPEIDVYMLTNFATPQYRRLCERLGAKGFFDKSTEFELVRDAIAVRSLHLAAQQADPQSVH